MTSPSSPMVQLNRLADASVSIVICNYNYERFVAEAIESALGQSLPCQVIVVDDGSTDGSRDIIARYADRVTTIVQPNAGQRAAYNTGFARCRGDIVIFLDSDDALDPQAAERAAAMFGDGVAKVHFRMQIVDGQGQPTGKLFPNTLARGDVRTALVRHGLLYPSSPGSGNAYRRDVLERLFPLPSDGADKMAADFFTVYGAAAFGEVAAIDEPLARYRIHVKATGAERLVFGNAAIGADEGARIADRYARLRKLVSTGTQGRVEFAPRFADFSVQKTPYAMGALARPYLGAWFASSGALRDLLKALWLQRHFSLGKRLGLSVWAVLILLAPRTVSHPLAQIVCNPASRGA